MDLITFSIYVLVGLFVLALIFDFMNGFHDAANSIATVVSTGVLRPQHAVIFAAACNFIALFIFGTTVAATVGKGIIDPNAVTHYIIFGTLVGAVAWNLITWYFGIPSSSSHALIGGLVGSGIAASGFDILQAPGIIRTVVFIFVAPTLGFILGGLLMLIVSHLFKRQRPLKVDRWFSRLQLVSAGLYSIGHGGNDAQKTIGIIWLLLLTANVSGVAIDTPPYWVVLLCYSAIALGTMFGGWRIVKTMGQRITQLKPVGGFCAELGGAITVFMSTFMGIPVSTTHTITGAIVGVGASRKFNAVRWGVAGNIVWAWIFTIPASAIIAGAAYYVGIWLL